MIIVHVILLCKEKPPTLHLERSVTESKDLNYCLVTNNNISERNKKIKFLYVSTIHLLLLTQKYEISPFRSATVEMTYKGKYLCLTARREK